MPRNGTEPGTMWLGCKLLTTHPVLRLLYKKTQKAKFIYITCEIARPGGQTVAFTIVRLWVRFPNGAVRCVLEQNTSFHVAPVHSAVNGLPCDRIAFRSGGGVVALLS
ncbi:Hypothetical predicted protein [Octopus vulgaris]|uniref:Uncharacterized protein n=1 Tax=Octopus vulgaris TaxID=6645 RepID=A0AA36ATR9_OCTVU|nr:Hypothetical predicted protein [Octopus vulgaris]